MKLTVPGNLDSLSAIAKFVMEAARLARLEKNTTYKLRLAVDEIATNIVQHGYIEAGLKGKIAIRAELETDCLKIILEDWGFAYNSTSYITANNLQKPLCQRQIGGLGIYLAMESVDNLQYHRIGDRNKHVFTVKR